MVEKSGVLLYGATGTTGRAVARRLKDVGLKATLAGRNQEKLKSIAEDLGFPFVAFPLTDTETLDSQVQRHSVVLHIAGPFTETAPPMLNACVRNRTHYLDVTGEFNVVELAKSFDESAKASNIMIMPAVGFDVVPGDCLASYLIEKLPNATSLELLTFVVKKEKSVQALPSHGTLLSALLHIIPMGGRVKSAGRIERERVGKRDKVFKLKQARKKRDSPLLTPTSADSPLISPTSPRTFSVRGMSFPSAELSSIAFSTSVPNVTLYVPGAGGFSMASLLLPFLSFVQYWPFKTLIQKFVEKFVPHPDISQTEGIRMMCAGEARNEDENKVARASVEVGPGYPFTAKSAVEIARRVLEGNFKPGFQSPASAYGSSLVLEIPGEEARFWDV